MVPENVETPLCIFYILNSIGIGFVSSVIWTFRFGYGNLCMELPHLYSFTTSSGCNRCWKQCDPKTIWIGTLYVIGFA